MRTANPTMAFQLTFIYMYIESPQLAITMVLNGDLPTAWQRTVCLGFLKGRDKWQTINECLRINLRSVSFVVCVCAYVCMCTIVFNHLNQPHTIRRIPLALGSASARKCWLCFCAAESRVVCNERVKETPDPFCFDIYI